MSLEAEKGETYQFVLRCQSLQSPIQLYNIHSMAESFPDFIAGWFAGNLKVVHITIYKSSNQLMFDACIL